MRSPKAHACLLSRIKKGQGQKPFRHLEDAKLLQNQKWLKSSLADALYQQVALPRQWRGQHLLSALPARDRGLADVPEYGRIFVVPAFKLVIFYDRHSTCLNWR